jgi:hypothetical protein
MGLIGAAAVVFETGLVGVEVVVGVLSDDVRLFVEVNRLIGTVAVAFETG